MILTSEKILNLAEVYGNAFYLLDSIQFEENYLQLRKAFSDIYSHFNIAYSYKTNYTPKLCKIVDSHGGYAEVVSEMELEIAFRIGVTPSKIIWNGPIKNTQKITQLLVLGGTVNIDSYEEAKTIVEISKLYPDHILNVGVRCNFDVGDGVVSRFGIDVDEATFIEAIILIRETENLRLINLHCHFAKRNIEFWPQRVKGMLKTVDKVAHLVGYIPKRIDLGGGIYGNMHESLKSQFDFKIPKYEEYAKIAATLVSEHFIDEKPELIIEPGSALAGDSMKFVGRIETIKAVRGKFFATMLGSQKNISMGGINPPVEIYPMGQNRNFYKNIDIVGYTCIESDVLYSDFAGEMGEGDFVVFSNCGSYSVVMKPPFIMPNFPVLDICGDVVEVIKRGETFDDLFHTFSF